MKKKMQNVAVSISLRTAFYLIQKSLGGSTANDIPDIGKFFADTKFALYVNNEVDTIFARSTIKAKSPRAATPNSDLDFFGSDINQLFLSPVHAVCQI